MDNADKKGKSAYQITLAAICLVLVLVGCQTDTPPATVEANALSARELYSQALEIAKEWKLDAYLIDVHVIGGEGNKQGDFVSYRFYSPSTPYIALDLDYDADSGSFTDKLFPASKLDFKDTLEIRDDDWKVDSPKALAIAQAHGGGEFLAKWDASPSLTLQKEESAGGVATVWRVSYFDVRSFETLRVRICAVSGQVLAVSTDRIHPIQSAISMILLFAVRDSLSSRNLVTLVFYVSFLTLANRYGRNLLLVGAAFALSLFSTYLLLRSVLLETVLSIDAYSLLTPWVYLVTALLCLVLAISSFFDSFSKRDFHQSRNVLHRTCSRLVFAAAAIKPVLFLRPPSSPAQVTRDGC